MTGEMLVETTTLRSKGRGKASRLWLNAGRLVIALAMAGCFWSEPSLVMGSGEPRHEGPQSSGTAALMTPPLPNKESRSTTSPVPQEFRYQMPRAGEVFLIWGINGWQPTPGSIRPPGTVIKKSVMHSPMAQQGDTFVAMVQVPAGGVLDYGFLITKLRSGVEAKIWDGAEEYRHTVVEAGIIDVKSGVTLDPFGNPVEKRGAFLFAVLAICFIGILVVSARLVVRAISEGTHGRSPVLATTVIPSTTEARFAVVVTALFLGLSVIILLSHEMWRDELQAWRIAASGSSLAEFFRILRHEGHPALWYLALRGLSRFSDNPFVMQIFHLCLATAGVYLLSRFAPFTRFQKVCLAFGYFSLYEYGAISRSYVMGIVGLFAFCALQDKVRSNAMGAALISALLLALVANTSIYGAMIALAFGMALAFDLFTARRQDHASATLLIVSLCLLVIGLGIATSIAQTVPPPDGSPHVVKWNASFNANRLEWTLAQIWKSYVPIPMRTVSFWNTNLLDEVEPVRIGSWQISSLEVQASLSLGLLGLALWVLARTPIMMFVYLIASAELLIFMQLKYAGGMRHAGHLFVVFVACLWMSLSGTHAANPAQSRLRGLVGAGTVRIKIMSLLFAVHTVAGLLAVRGDLLFSFSASQEVARFLTEHHLSDLPMIGSKHYVASAVALHLDRPMYYAESDRVGTYIVWKSGRRPVSPEELLQKAEDLAVQHGRDVVLVLTYDLGPEGDSLRKIGLFNHNIISNERYVVYLKCHSKVDSPTSFAPSENSSTTDEERLCP